MLSAAIANCVWCETEVKASVRMCPECGLENPVLKAEAPAVAAGGGRKRRGRRFLLAFVAVPLMLSAAYAAQVQGVTSSLAVPFLAAAPATVTAPAPGLTDPLQRSVWSDGVKSVRMALTDPNFSQFADSFVSVSTGRIVSFCGALPGTAAYGDGMGGQRFISIFGQRQSTVLENGDGSFDVLWNRVCASPTQQA
jgi:hypothetical protein